MEQELAQVLHDAVSNFDVVDVAAGEAKGDTIKHLVSFGLGLLGFFVMCGHSKFHRWMFGQLRHLQERATAVEKGTVTDPHERGMITEATSRVTAARILAGAILIGLAIVQ